MSRLNAFTVLCRALLSQKVRKRFIDDSSETDVIVFASEAIGDNLVFLDVLHFLEEESRKESRSLIFICDKKMFAFWNLNKLYESTELLAVDKRISKETMTNIDKVRRIKIGKIILPMHHTLSVIVANCFHSNAFYGMLYNEWIINRPSYIKRLYKTGNKHIIHIEDGRFIGFAYEQLIENIYGKKYVWGLPEISYDKAAVEFENYVFFAPYSNLPERSLSEEQIVEIIRYLIHEHDCTVVFSGTTDNQEDAERVSALFSSNKLINLVGKTTFNEYLNFIAEAKLVVGTDSGSIHYAASFGVKSVALVGLWSGAFLPYKNNKYGRYPRCICAREKMDCKYCLNKPGGIASCNLKCYENARNGKRRLCLESIDINDVKLALSGEL